MSLFKTLVEYWHEFSENSQQFKHKSKKMALTNYNLVSRLLLNFEDWKNERNVQIVFKYVQLSVPNRKRGELTSVVVPRHFPSGEISGKYCTIWFSTKNSRIVRWIVSTLPTFLLRSKQDPREYWQILYLGNLEAAQSYLKQKTE